MQKERDKILTDLFRSQDLANCIAKMDHRHLHDELKSELFVVLSALPYEKIIGMKERNELNFYIFATIRNMVNSGTSKFHKEFRQSGLNCYTVDYQGQEASEPIDTLAERLRREQQSEDEVRQMHTVIDEMYWYDKAIIKLYLEHQSIRKVAKKLDIPPSSIKSTLDRCKEIIRKQLG